MTLYADVRLWEQGLSESEIGRQFNTTHATVRKSIAWRHSTRNMRVPRFSDRRQAEIELVAKLHEGGHSLDEIAVRLGRSDVTVRKMLDEWYKSRGKVRPDERSQRRRSG